MWNFHPQRESLNFNVHFYTILDYKNLKNSYIFEDFKNEILLAYKI